jgi:hypothetical protein
MIASCVFGLLLGLLVIPAAFFGPSKTAALAREWNRVLIQPALFHGQDRSRAGELLDINGTDNQSFVALLHRWRNFDETVTIPRPLRSRPLEPWASPAHWAIAVLLTALTLLAARWRAEEESALTTELFASSLAVLMLLSSPVSHVHYFTLLLPLAMGLMVIGRGNGAYPTRKWIWLFAAVAASGALPLLPGLGALRDLCMASFGALALWGAGLIAMRRSVAEFSVIDQHDTGRLKPAARIGIR